MSDALKSGSGRQVEGLRQGRRRCHRDHHLGLLAAPVGSQLGVDDTGAMVGSVSGGCIEGAVVKEALGAIKDGKPRLLDFGVTDEQAWDVGLACGGKVQVFVEKVN
jgi:xanthine/CO dehydrogenase XdhC/CoxF family maturation factor